MMRSAGGCPYCCMSNISSINLSDNGGEGGACADDDADDDDDGGFGFRIEVGFDMDIGISNGSSVGV